MSDDLTIENKLKDFRKHKELSQEELADALGITRQSVIALEQGHSMPSLPLAVSLCRFFNAAFEDIFEFEREIDEQIDEAFRDHNINVRINNDPASIGSRKENAMFEIEPWRPMRDAVSLRDAMDRLFEDSVITPSRTAGAMPRIDIKDQKGAILVRAELPGMKEDDIDIEVADNVMTISGERKEEIENPPAGGGEDKSYYYKESFVGKFSRSFTLPAEVKAEKAVADMKDGILSISIPKIEPKKAAKVKISAKK